MAMIIRSLLLTLLLGLAAAAPPSCSPGDVCLGEEEVEDGSLIQKRAQDAKDAKEAAKRAGGDQRDEGGLDCISDTGKQVTTSGTLSDFTAISASSNLEVKFQTGSTSSYTARVDKAFESVLSVKVSGSTLEMQYTECVSSTNGQTVVTVTAPKFPTEITLSGGAEFDNKGGSETVDALTVTASGGGEVTLKKVTADKCIFQVSGGAQISETTCNTLEVNGSGGGEIKVTLTGSATGSLSGAAELDVKGGGSTSGVETSGAATINHR